MENPLAATRLKNNNSTRAVTTPNMIAIFFPVVCKMASFNFRWPLIKV